MSQVLSASVESDRRSHATSGSSAASPSDAQHWILRQASNANTGTSGVDVEVVARPAIRLVETPGWLTGESLADQGVEVAMPNLPTDLPLPPVEGRPFRCRVEVVGPGVFRVVLGPDDARVFEEDPTWLGIVTDATVGSSDCDITRDEDRIRISSGNHDLTIGLDPFRLRLVNDCDERLVRTSERLRQVAGFPMAPAVSFHDDGAGTRIELGIEMAPDEHILGFGEQFSRLVKNGQHLSLRIEDALGTGTGLTYKPIPVWHSTRGYLGFLNTGATVEADVGHHRASVLSLMVHDEAVDLYLVAAPTPAERLATYTELTGRGRRPPLWAFGSWMGRCRYRTAEEVLAVCDRMHAEDLPADVVHVDPDWLVTDRLNTDFIWNTDRFGDRRQFVDDVRDRSMRVSIWEVPYLDPVSPRYEEAEREGHLLRTIDNEVANVRGTPSPDGRPRALVDMTNAASCRWWQDLHGDFLRDGIAVFKTDFGEGCPDDAAARDGTPPNHLHNLYALRYNAAVSDAFEQVTGRDPLVWGRSGWAGSQRYPGQWGGDAESTVAGMQASLRGGLSYALCAPGFWSHDIGGFFGPELTPGLYVRWTQFGALSPLMRAHGLRPREPWAFGPEALDICRSWIRLRYSLIPYIWQVAAEVPTLGLPMLRPLALEFPEDPVAPFIDDQFLLGSELLVAPVLDDRMRTVDRRVYLPAGAWFDFHTDQAYHGPAFVDLEVPIDSMPIFVRRGASIPRVDIDASIRSTDDIRPLPWTAHLYGEADRRSFEGFDGEPVMAAHTVRHG